MQLLPGFLLAGSAESLWGLWGCEEWGLNPACVLENPWDGRSWALQGLCSSWGAAVSPKGCEGLPLFPEELLPRPTELGGAPALLQPK